MDSFWDFSNEKEGGCLIQNFKDLCAPIVLAEQILNYFKSCFQGGLKRLKCPFLYFFFTICRYTEFYFLSVEIFNVFYL